MRERSWINGLRFFHQHDGDVITDGVKQSTGFTAQTALIVFQLQFALALGANQYVQ
jgi:hypothetical protein